jgi:antirestriction protein
MTTETKIYVGTFAKYNAGSISGEWLTLQDYSSADEFFEAMAELHSDEEDPEYMIQDKEGFLSDSIGESLSIQELEDIFEAIEAVESSHLDADVIQAYIDNIGGDIDSSTIADAEEAYQGEFKSDEDFAEEMAEQLGYMNEAKGWPFNCIDWEWAARELMYDYFESGGHYFRNL